MKKLVVFFLISICFFLSASCDNGQGIDNELIINRSYCLDRYEGIMLTVQEIVNENFYQERGLEKFERIRIDTTMSSTLYVKYRFNYNADDYQMSINNLIIFEPNEAKTKETYNYYKSSFNRIGINSNETTKLIDEELSFGVESEAYEYRMKDRVAGYFMIGRTKNLMVYYIARGNHIEHLNYFKVLQQKIEKINEITIEGADNRTLKYLSKI